MNPNWNKTGLKNRFTQGRCANPRGRPKKEICIPDILRKIGSEKVPKHILDQLQKTYGKEYKPANMREAMLRTAYIKAIKGDESFQRTIMERTEGKVTDKLDVTDTTPTKIVFEEVLVGGQVVANSIKRTITRPNDNPS